MCLAAGPSAPRRPTVWAAATVTHASVGARRPPAKAEGTVARPSAEGVTVARPSAQRVSSQRRAAAVAEVSDAELLRAERQALLTVEGMYIYICIFVCRCRRRRRPPVTTACCRVPGLPVCPLPTASGLREPSFTRSGASCVPLSRCGRTRRSRPSCTTSRPPPPTCSSRGRSFCGCLAGYLR